MNPDRDQSIARLLEDSQDMVRRFEALVGKDQVVAIDAEAEKSVLENLDEGLEPAADGFFDLFVQEDGMAALAEFRPPAGDGKPLSLDQIELVFAERQVVHGALWNVIKDALDACNLDRKLGTGVVVAKGTPPVPAVPAHVAIEARWTEAHKPAADPTHDVDFKEITPFVLVATGDLLALRIGEVQGQPGTDVRGQPVPFPTTECPVWTPGTGVVETAIGFEAGVDGRLLLDKGTFLVNPVLELTEGVDYKTGNIHFKGEVIIKGKVSAGFSLEVGGSLSTSDVLDAFSVKVAGDLTTPGGIIGNGPGRVDVGGAVAVKFLEYVHLTAQGDVRAEACALNSVIKTRGKVVLGDKGILAGGQVHALHGVELYQIGTATGPRTELMLGLDYLGMERILWIRERSKELHLQLKKVDAAIPYGGARVPELMAAAKKIRLEIVQLTETARAQLVNLGQDEAATVVVRGAVYPGTTIEICHVRFQVTEKLTSVRFFLDKRKGIVAFEPLTAPSPGTTTPSGTGSKKH